MEVYCLLVSGLEHLGCVSIRKTIEIYYLLK